MSAPAVPTRRPENVLDVVTCARAVATELAAPAADEVDRVARPPHEALSGLRRAGLLGAMIAVEDGGLGAGFAEIVEATTELARACSSTGMIFAMHQIQIACLVEHGRTPALRAFRRRVAEEQLLLASATTEVGIGGDVRRSSCAIEQRQERVFLEKQAPVISYAEVSDAILATARRSGDAPSNDQVLVACPRADVTLTPTTTWDTLGFRGTASLGYLLSAEVPSDLVFPVAYGDLSATTMLPVSHAVWSAVWLGIAEAAEAKARRFVQDAARAAVGAMPPGALRLAELHVTLQRLRDTRDAAVGRYLARAEDRDEAGSITAALQNNAVKVTASELVVEVVHQALLICGMAGYREDSPLRLGRLLRDAHGAALMVGNDRILANNAQLLLVHRGA